MFKAVLIENDDQGYRAALTELAEDRLPAGDVTVDVVYSTLNYKDGLAITGKGPIARSFPMVPGIDFVGVVRGSEHPDFRTGDKVILNGWGVGESHWGGLAQKARVKGDWLIPLPPKMSARCAMMLGTAGYTAMLCVSALEKHGISPGDGDVLVTGANGGVGSVAIMLLSKLGYKVVAATGRTQESRHLENIGASEILDRNSISKPGKPLQKERWSAAIDSVGSHTLANICAGVKSDGAVAACGMAQGLDFPASVAPFILRGVTLYGINSVTRPKAERVLAWDRLASLLPETMLEPMAATIGLSSVPIYAEKLMAGELRGRVVVDVNK
ncbi:oxidoreductase [Afipia massiliensis]|uniref:Oxidoreductase n=1 Tax=Afipia massiliensis TaxID=211460 RepID=A0A4U6BQ35_9BRAD|nr:MDR family oxidoreductase [Afipia massiliensis]TKT70854.1 oxidoreductase [Afipia massiliensis]